MFFLLMLVIIANSFVFAEKKEEKAPLLLRNRVNQQNNMEIIHYCYSPFLCALNTFGIYRRSQPDNDAITFCENIGTCCGCSQTMAVVTAKRIEGRTVEVEVVSCQPEIDRSKLTEKIKEHLEEKACMCGSVIC